MCKGREDDSPIMILRDFVLDLPIGLAGDRAEPN